MERGQGHNTNEAEARFSGLEAEALTRTQHPCWDVCWRLRWCRAVECQPAVIPPRLWSCDVEKGKTSKNTKLRKNSQIPTRPPPPRIP